MRLALGPRYRCLGYVERDSYAAASLVARMEDQTLDPAPVWDDLATFDGRPWRGRVALLTAGFPCQPFSDSGQKRGLDDDRWLWPHVARIVEEVAPAVAFFENVPPLVTHGLHVVLADLSRLGFDAEWSCLSAAALGASQERDRFWLLAYRHGGGLDSLRWEPGHDRLPRHDADRPGGPPVEHAPGVNGRTGLHPGAARRVDGQPAGVTGGVLADAVRPGLEGGVHGSPERWEGPPWDGGSLFPPGPDDLDDWAAVLARAPELEPCLRRVAPGMAHRLDRLRVVGGGVVPLVAASAFCGLVRRAQGGSVKSDLIDGQADG